MKKMLVFLLFVFPLTLWPFVPSSSRGAGVAREVPLMRKELPDLPGKEALIETVVFSPGEVDPPHRHNADVFAYVLEGSIMTQLKGGKTRIVHTGEVFYESPTDVHIASRNTSNTKPAKLLVFFVKKTGAPSTVPVANAAH
jgi:quercetin dioxygenase-like cupin family protein